MNKAQQKEWKAACQQELMCEMSMTLLTLRQGGRSSRTVGSLMLKQMVAKRLDE
jgi:hypothetical protein